MMGRDYRQQATRAANLLKVTKALQECPKSVSEICTETGVSGTTVSRLCKELRDSGGAYIAMYEQNRSTWAAVWSLGIGTDAKMPRRQTKRERREYVRQWKARQEIRRTSIDRFDPLRDYRGFLEQWACPDLSALPRSIYLSPQA